LNAVISVLSIVCGKPVFIINKSIIFLFITYSEKIGYESEVEKLLLNIPSYFDLKDMNKHSNTAGNSCDYYEITSYILII